MTQNLKIEVLTGDIPIDGMVVTNLVTKEELSTAIVKKADLGADGKIPTSQLPAEIVNTAGIVDEVKLQLETSIKDAVDESNAYAESYTDNALSSKADLTSGKVPLEQLPTIDQYPQFGTTLSSLSTSILTAMKQRTDQLEKSKADLGEDGKVLREQIPSYEKISGLPEQLEVMSTQTAAVSKELSEHKVQIAELSEDLRDYKFQTDERLVELNALAKADVFAINVADAGGSTQQEINDFVGAKWRSKLGGYALNARVMLENGDVVKSTVVNNTKNPNYDMSGWINAQDASFVVDGNENQHQINNSLIRIVSNKTDLLTINNPRNQQVVYVIENKKRYIYNPNLTAAENGVTIIGKWEMEVQEAYYASWFCPSSSIDNVNNPQTDTLNKAYRYATERGRSFIIDQTYYVESIGRKGLNAYPSLGGNDLLDYAIRVLSNSILIFKKGVGKLKLVPNNKTHSRVLCVFDVENYAIFDPECIGDKGTHLGTTGEQHYMIAFHASKNGYVRNPVCRNSWGDGLYFGYPEYVSVFNVDVDYPTNLVIDNPKIYNSSRNGISLCGAENLTINNPLIDIVDRIAPVSGIDIEPEEDFVYGGKRMHLKNVKIHNATIKNCNNYGVMSFIYGNREIDISFTGTTTFSAKAPYYCSFPIWHCSYRGDDLTEAQYTASGAINFEKVVMSDAQAQWLIVSPISFHSELGKVKINIGDLTHTKHQTGAVGFGFDNPTSVTASWSGGLSVSKITLNGVDVVELWGNNSASTPAKKLRYIDLPIPSYMQVGYESNKLQFETNVNIGGYARLNSKGWYNTDELINNTIFTPKANPGDGNSIQARIYDLGEISNGRTMVYSLESDLTTPQIGDGLYVHCGRLFQFTSPLSTATCEFQSNGVRKLKSSFGVFTIY